MGAQAFAGVQQPHGVSAYPPARQEPLDSRMSYSPHGGRTPGRGTFRTPFASLPQGRPSHSPSRLHSPGVTQPLAESGFVSQAAMTADASADRTSSAQIMTSLEALSFTDSMSTQRLSPIVTQPALLPSSVILARTAQRTSAEEQPTPATAAAAAAPAAAAQISSPQQQIQVSDSASLADPTLVTSSEVGSEPVAPAGDAVGNTAFGRSPN